MLNFNSKDIAILQQYERFNKTSAEDLASLSGYYPETVQKKLTLWRGCGVIQGEQARINWGAVWPDAYAVIVEVTVVRVDVLERLVKDAMWKQVHQLGRKKILGFAVFENADLGERALELLVDKYHCSDVRVLVVQKTWW